jgi:hypothetical protein
MILFQEATGMKRLGRNFTLMVVALVLAACAPVDDSIGSRLSQPPPNSPPQPITESGDIAIVGQEVAHSILDLPVVANATVPPLVQFTGVTSIVDKPIDTEPYTELLRDRLLLITRLKLRFVEHTLPPYVPPSKHKKKEEAPQPVQNTENPDYEILAELRGHAEDEFYKIQVEFVDIHSSQVLFNGLYRIKPESSTVESIPGPPPSEPTSVPVGNDIQAPPAQDNTQTPPTHGVDAPTTTSPQSGNESL